MMRVRFDEPRPLTCHILLTTACNLDCDGCFYRRDEPREIPLDRLTRLLEDLAYEGVWSIAFGGGEPTLYPKINEAIHEAKVRGFYVAVTTNGAVIQDFDPLPDRVHLSYSSMHREALRKVGVIPFRQIKKALEHYKAQGITVGINCIYHNLLHFKHMDMIFSEADNITILLEKQVRDGVRGFIAHPWRRLEEHIAENRERYWLDACLVKLMRGTPCKQGVSSFSIDQDLMARRCSNTETRIPYTTVAETWTKLTGIRDCILPCK
jgi:MoaA/NifB/PqqE/SkfB family radical SAM enzyme